MVYLNSYTRFNGLELLFPRPDLDSLSPSRIREGVAASRAVAEREGLIQRLPEAPSPAIHPLFRSGRNPDAIPSASAPHFFERHPLSSLQPATPLSRSQLSEVYRQYLILKRHEEQTHGRSPLTTQAFRFLLEATSQAEDFLGHHTAAEDNRADYRLLTEISQELLHSIASQRVELQTAVSSTQARHRLRELDWDQDRCLRMLDTGLQGSVQALRAMRASPQIMAQQLPALIRVAYQYHRNTALGEAIIPATREQILVLRQGGGDLRTNLQNHHLAYQLIRGSRLIYPDLPTYERDLQDSLLDLERDIHRIQTVIRNPGAQAAQQLGMPSLGEAERLQLSHELAIFQRELGQELSTSLMGLSQSSQSIIHSHLSSLGNPPGVPDERFLRLEGEVWRSYGRSPLRPGIQLTMASLQSLLNSTYEQRLADTGGDERIVLTREREETQSYLTQMQGFLSRGEAVTTQEALNRLGEESSERLISRLGQAFAHRTMTGESSGNGALVMRVIEAEEIQEIANRENTYIHLARRMATEGSHHRADGAIGSLLASLELSRNLRGAPSSLGHIARNFLQGTGDTDDFLDVIDHLNENQTVAQRAHGLREALPYTQAVQDMAAEMTSMRGGLILMASMYTAGLASEFTALSTAGRLGVSLESATLTAGQRAAIESARFFANWSAYNVSSLGLNSIAGHTLSAEEVRSQLSLSFFSLLGGQLASLPFAYRSALLRIPAMSVGMVHGEDVYGALFDVPHDTRSLPARYFGALVGTIPYELGGLGIRGVADVQRYLGDLGGPAEDHGDVARIRREMLLYRVQEAIQAEHTIEQGLGVQELIPVEAARSLLLRQMTGGSLAPSDISLELGRLIRDIREGRTALRMENGALRAVPMTEGERVARSQAFSLVNRIEDLLAIDNGHSIRAGLLPMNEATMTEAREFLLRQASAGGRSPEQAVAFIRELIHQVQEGGSLHIRGGEVHIASITSLHEAPRIVEAPTVSNVPEEMGFRRTPLPDRPTVRPPRPVTAGRSSTPPAPPRDSIPTGVLAAAGMTAPFMPMVYDWLANSLGVSGLHEAAMSGHALTLGFIAAHVLALVPGLGVHDSRPSRDTFPDGISGLSPGHVGFIFGGQENNGVALPLASSGTPTRVGNSMVRYNPDIGQCEVSEQSGEWRPLALGEQFESAPEGRFILVELNLAQIRDLRDRVLVKGSASAADFDREVETILHEQLSTHGIGRHLASLGRLGVAVDGVDERNASRFFGGNLNEALVSYDAGHVSRTQGGITGGISRLYAFVDPQTGEIYRFCSRQGSPSSQRSERWVVRRNPSGDYEWFERRGRVAPLDRTGIPSNGVVVSFVYQRMTGRISVGDLSQAGLSEAGAQRISHLQGLVVGTPSSYVMAVLNRSLF